MVKRKTRSEQMILEYPGHKFRPLEVADFVQAPIFTRAWARSGLGDDELRVLEIIIMTDPKAKESLVIKGTGGLRKVLFLPPTRHKAGKPVTACYVYFEDYNMVLLVLAYEENENDELTPGAKKAAKNLIERQKAELSKRTIV